MKKIFLFTIVLLLSVSLLVSAVPKKKPAKPAASFVKSGLYVTPEIGLYSGNIPFGATVEYGLTENIGVGGTVMAWFWSGFGVIAPSAEVCYHFTQLDVEKLDVSGGGGIGFAIGTGGASSALYLYPYLNGRYFFKEKIAVNLRLNFGIGDYSGVGSWIGVTFFLGKK